jgi:hypothetical protein
MMPNITPVALRDRPLHVHFGAGSIGLGCAVPLFEPHRRILVVQRRSTDAPMRDVLLEHGNEVQVLVHLRDSTDGPSKYRFRVIDARQNDAGSLIEKHRHQHILLFAELSELSLFTGLIGEGLTFSVAVKEEPEQKKIVRQLAQIPFSDRRPPVFLLENSHTTEDPESIAVEPVVVDRICSRERELGHSGEVNISTEKFSGFISRVGLDFVTPTWQVVSDPTEFEFFVRRKKYMVNSVHLAFVILGFEYLRNKGFTLTDWSKQLLPVLLDAMHEPEYDDTMRTFVRAQAMRLVMESAADVLSRLYPESSSEHVYRRLLLFSDSVWARMRAVPDGVARVFGIKLDAKPEDFMEAATGKFKGHLKPFHSWVTSSRKKIESFPAVDPPTFAEVLAVSKHLSNVIGAPK